MKRTIISFFFLIGLMLTFQANAQRGGHGGGGHSGGGYSGGGGHSGGGYGGGGYGGGRGGYAGGGHSGYENHGNYSGGRSYGYGGGYRPQVYARSYPRVLPYYGYGYGYGYARPRVYIAPPIIYHDGWTGYYHQGCPFCEQGYCRDHFYYNERLYNDYLRYQQGSNGNYNNRPYDDYDRNY